MLVNLAEYAENLLSVQRGFWVWFKLAKALFLQAKGAFWKLQNELETPVSGSGPFWDHIKATQNALPLRLRPYLTASHGLRRDCRMYVPILG